MWESVSVKRIIKGSHKRVSKHKGEVRTYEGRRQGRVTCFSLRCQTDRAPINTRTREVHLHGTKRKLLLVLLIAACKEPQV
jgi:hypothetical protein